LADEPFDLANVRADVLYDRLIDAMKELVEFTLLNRDAAVHLTNRYSERKESATRLEGVSI